MSTKKPITMSVRCAEAQMAGPSCQHLDATVTAPTPEDREAVFAAVAPLLPALQAWFAKWQAEHPGQTIVSRYVTKVSILTQPEDRVRCGESHDEILPGGSL